MHATEMHDYSSGRPGRLTVSFVSWFVCALVVGALCASCTFVGGNDGNLADRWQIYWTDIEEGTITRATLDGLSRETVVQSRAPRALAVAGDTLFWADAASCSVRYRTVGRAEDEVVLGDPDTCSWDRNVFDLALDRQRSKIYWIEGTERIMRANTDGTAAELLVDGGRYRAVAIDPSGEKIYWGTYEGTIGRANLNGEDTEEIISEAQSVFDVAVDPAGEKIYWADNNANSIGRANLDGSGRGEVITGVYPFSLTLYPEAGYLYWSDGDHIYRSAIDDFERMSLVEDIVGEPEQLAFSTDHDVLYWIESPRGVATAKVRGTNVSSAATETLFTGTSRPFTLTVDGNREAVYWTGRPGTVAASHLDGSGKQLLASVACGETTMGDLALDSRRQMLYWMHFTDCGSAVERVSTDGGSVEKLPAVVGRSFEIGGVAVEEKRGLLYWTSNRRNAEGIYRGNLDGTGGKRIVETTNAWALSIDVRGQKIYWLQWTETGDKIQRANLDGSVREDVLTRIGDAADLAIDPRGRMLYWSETDAGKIRRATLEGTGVEDVFIELSAPTGVAFDISHDY